MFHPKNVTNSWFYSTPPVPFLFLTIFVWGDALVIFPFLVLILSAYLFGLGSNEFFLILLGVCFAVRSCGEMLYWMHQQFGEKKYRPRDFGFTQLGNNAIYILYQLLVSVQAAVWISFVIYILHYA